MNLESAIKKHAIISYSVSFVFVLSLSLYAYNNSINMFWADEWDTPGNLLIKEINQSNEINFHDFNSQHNESRKLIPKLLYYAAYKFGIFDTRIGVLIRITLSIFSVLLISYICKFSDKRLNSITFLLATLLIFIPTQSYNQIFGLQFITIVPSFCLILIILVNKSITNTSYCAILSIILCVISTYTYSNGLIIWVIGNPLIFKLFKIKDFKWIEVILFNVIFVIITALYFYEYQHPTHHPGMVKGLLHPLRTFKYFTLWLWSPFVIHLPHIKYLCILLTIVYFTITLSLGFRIKQLFKSGTITMPLLCPLLLMIYGLTSGGIASLGRSGFGVMAALGPQYPSFALWAHLGICLLVLSGFPFKNKVFRTIVVAAYSTLYATCFESGIKDFTKWSHKMKQCKLTVEHLNICPNNSLISDFHPAPASITAKAKLFSANNLISYAKNDWLLSTKPSTGSSCGFVTTTKNSRTVNLFGWANIPGTKKPADYVFVTSTHNETISPLSFLFLDVKRTDVINALKSKSTEYFGFNKTLTVNKEIDDISCYAVDEKNKILYKLAEF